MRIFPLAILLAAVPATLPAMAGGFQDIAALDRRVANALGAGIGEPGGAAGPIDPQLHLAACPQSVTIDPPAAGALAIRCPGLGWRIRVPLARLAGFAPPQGGYGAGAAVGYGGAQARAEPVIRRGDPVDLVAGSAGFSVSVAAIAQEDGALGARIRVRTDGGRPQNQIVFAEIVAPGQVRMPGYQ